jgi:hypothetical protein
VSGRPSREVTLAAAYQQRTGCTPAAAAEKYGVAVSSVRRALARVGVPAKAVGRPAKAIPAPADPFIPVTRTLEQGETP